MPAFARFARGLPSILPKRLKARRIAILSLVMLATISARPSGREEKSSAQVIRLWPGTPPGTQSWKGQEQTIDAQLPNVGKVHIITNVTTPTVTVFRPQPGTGNGTGMIVVPGGAFRALPWDLEGTEIARWLTKRGVTAFLLKYRVRPPANSQSSGGDGSFEAFARSTQGARNIAVADAEQAMRLIRSNAHHFGIARDHIGMIGFSAGAMTTMIVARSSDPSVRPDFAASLYGALLGSEAPPRGAPPLFIVAAQDDPQVPAKKSIEIFERWTAAKLPAELHLYEAGGHGFALRSHHLATSRWPIAFEAWLASRGFMRPPGDRCPSPMPSSSVSRC